MSEHAALELDRIGRVPRAEKAVEFLDRRDTNNDEKLIDEFLASPQFGRT